MQALKAARKLIEKNHQKAAAQTVSRLVLALESETPFNISELYQLDFDDFELAIEVMKDWRLDRYYTSKAVLLDLALQLDLQAKAHSETTATVEAAESKPAEDRQPNPTQSAQPAKAA